MNNCFGKRFLFGIVAIICVTVAAVMCKFTESAYVTLVGSITGLFMVSQSITDMKKP